MKTPARRRSTIVRLYPVLVGLMVLIAAVLMAPSHLADSSWLRSEKESAATNNLKTSKGDLAKRFDLSRWISPLSLPAMAGETIELLAADCATPKTDFAAGETICAKTDGVDLTTVPNNYFVNWFHPDLSETNGGTITTNPQYTLFSIPTSGSYIGTWKANIGRVTPAEGSIIGSPALFTVSDAPAIATFAADCTTPKTSFTLGDVVCAKVTGITPAFNRRIAWVDPSGITRTFASITTNPQSDSFTLPTDETSLIDIFVVDNRGRWKVNVVSSRASTVVGQGFTVSGAVQTADLSISKSLVGDAPESGTDVTFAIAVTNNGPDAAVNVEVADVTPLNATFSSVNPVSGGLSCAGTTTVTCTRASLGVGEVAVFEVTYNASGASGSTITNVATVESDTDELDPLDNTAIYAVVIGGGSGTPAECVLNCPPSLIVATDTPGGPGATVTFGTANSTGSCGALTATPASGSLFLVGTTTVNVTSATGSGSCSFTVTVIDEPSPTITCAANQTEEAASGQSTASVTVVTPSATGSGVVVTGARGDDLTIVDPYSIGTTAITWTATDQFDRFVTCTQLITVTPAEPLTISCPANVTVPSPSGCDPATGVSVGTATSNSSTAEILGRRSDNLAYSNSPEFNDPYAVGTTLITWTASDTDGQSATCTQTVTVTSSSDNTPPTLNVPANISATTSSCTLVVDDELGVATAEDACSTVSISRTGLPQIPCPIPGDPGRTCDSFNFPTGTTVITYTATDVSGNVATGTQLVTVLESPALNPTISAPGDLTIDTLATDAVCGTFIGDATLGSANANDNCPGVTVTRTGVPVGNVFPVGNTTITYTATDRSGNTATDTQIITVNDKTPPAISCPANITVYLPANTPDTSMAVSYTAPVGADNCAGATTTQTAGLASGATFPLGTTTNTFRVTDASGNYTECSFTVTVLFNFTGFFSPIGNPPVLNAVNAGRAIPIKFSLSGDKGLNIFAPNNPYTVSYNCATNDPGVDVTETSSAGGSSLSYSPDTYHYTWKTEKSWAGTCRQLVVTLNDGSVHVANFKFK